MLPLYYIHRYYFPPYPRSKYLRLTSSPTGLSQISLQAVSKLLDSPEYAEDVISVMRCVITQFTVKDLESESIEVPVHVKLWRVNGCHELLASLGERRGWEEE